VTRFDLHTDVTVLYWDVIGNVAVTLTVTKGGESAKRQYATTCKERTYLWPSRELITQVLDKCTHDIGSQFRQDADIAHALRG
ncbi:MAG: hypothetical protein WAW96_10280, partial [Alphaproteobacteria bacterium]